MIGILTAVREELRPLLRKMPRVDVESAGGVVFYRGELSGKAVVAARSGMGEERARRAALLMAKNYRLDSILAAGFGGGLSAELVPGDVVVASRVFESHVPDASLAAAAEQTRLENVRIHYGGLYSVDQVVSSVLEKRELGARHKGWMALDMESAAIADVAAQARVPWLAVRAITDGLEDALPALVDPFQRKPCIDPGTGEVIPLRMAALVMFSPRTAVELARLGRRAGLAARNLAEFVESYVGRL